MYFGTNTKDGKYMKKFSKLLLVLLLCFTFIGCSNKKNTAEITKLLKESTSETMLVIQLNTTKMTIQL